MISKLVDPDLFHHLLREILLVCPPKKKSKYSTSYYLCILLFILKTGTSYRNTCALLFDAPKNHHTTIFKKFSAWSQAGVFRIIYEKLLECYSKETYSHLSSLDLFVDSTHIRNKNGQDMISYGKKDKGKKGHTLTLIVDKDRFPVFAQMNPANNHDGGLIDPILDHLDTQEYLPPNLNVIGDKGYVKKKRIRLGKRTINLVFPSRKNQKRKNTKKELSLLKTRPVIENVFATLKQFRRISNRYDRISFNYFEYLYLAISIMGLKVLNKLKSSKSVKNISKKR